MGVGATIGVGFSNGSGLAQLQKVHYTIRNFYIDPVDEDKLETGAITGYLASLNDPYTRYVDAPTFAAMQNRVLGESTGVGLYVMLVNGAVLVARVIPHSSAAKAGMMVGDQIMGINRTTVKGLSVGQVHTLLKGSAGSVVTIEYARKGRLSTLQLDRMPMTQMATIGVTRVGTIGVMSIPTFESSGVPDEFKKKLQALLDTPITGLVIDVRFNGGGLLSGAIKVASLLLPDTCVVKITDRYGVTKEEWTVQKPLTTQLPLVVLVNSQTASAAEVFAAAIQDHQRGTIMGQHTYGKTAIQKVLPLGDGSGLIYTNARYRSPKGRDISKQGIKVDRMIPIPTKDLGKDTGLQMAISWLGG